MDFQNDTSGDGEEEEYGGGLNTISTSKFGQPNYTPNIYSRVG